MCSPWLGLRRSAGRKAASAGAECVRWDSIWVAYKSGCPRYAIPIAPEPHVAFTTDLGRSLRFMANDWGGSLVELDAWCPAYESDYGHVQFTIEVPTEALKPDEVNWIEFRQESALTLQYPFTIAAMAPCIPPLWSDG